MTPLQDIVAEADRVLQAARTADVPVRLLGGLAIERHLGDATPLALRRGYEDIDLATPKGRARDVGDVLKGVGYTPDVEFNTLNGARRMIFGDPEHRWKVDVFVGVFEMCHSIPITDRLGADTATIPLAELLLTKLQVVELNEKDRRDLVALLLGVPIGDRDAGEINGRFIAELLANDWGLWRTTRLNLDRVHDGVADYQLTENERQRVKRRCDALWALIEAEPKSWSWRIRDLVGERKRWYQVPEEV